MKRGEHKVLKEELRESEERFSSLINDLLDSLAVGMLILDSDFRVVWVNQALERFFGLRRDEIIGNDKRQLIRERIKYIFEDPEDFANRVLATYENNTYIENFECHVLLQDESKERWLEHWSQPIRSGLYARGRIEYYYDITERKRVEEEIENLAKFPSENPYPVLRIAKDGTLLYANTTSLSLLSDWDCQVGQSVPNQWRQLVADVLDSGLRKNIEIEHRGQIFLFSVVPVVDANYVNLYGLDITESKKAEEEIKSNQKKVEILINSSSDLIFLKDRDFRYLIANKVHEELFNIKIEDIIGKTDFDFMPKEAAEGRRRSDEEALKSKGPIEREEMVGDRCFQLVKQRVVDATGNIVGVVAVIRDITEHKKADQTLQDAYQKLKETQEELIQSSKMAAMGQLAAGVSHELNQPLTGIKGFTQAVLMDLDNDNPIRADLKRIEEQADRMDKIIKNVRFFARKSEFKMEKLDINQPIEDSFMFLSQQLKVHNIRLKKSLAKNLPKIKGDQNQLQQAFLNLITNARDAIDNLKNPDGGELIIKSALSKNKKNIEVTFKDTGCGISKKNLDNVFNPFFTTKFSDGGIGLGLSIVYRIVENHKGKIEVSSVEGKGTIFKIKLPVK